MQGTCGSGMGISASPVFLISNCGSTVFLMPSGEADIYHNGNLRIENHGAPLKQPSSNTFQVISDALD